MVPVCVETGIAAGQLREHQQAKLATQVCSSKNAVPLKLDDTRENLCTCQWYWYVRCLVKDYAGVLPIFWIQAS
jgi:hypothetical protein